MSYTGGNYYSFEDDETIYELSFEGEYPSAYVVANSDESAMNIARRLFDRMDSYDGWRDYISVQDTGSTDIEGMARGPEQPFSVIVPHRYYMVEYEKRVNQAGFKGIYQVIRRY